MAEASDAATGRRVVAEGRTDVVVPVSDGSEIGPLQAGFDRMVAGLREREHVRDMFGWPPCDRDDAAGDAPRAGARMTP